MPKKSEVKAATPTSTATLGKQGIPRRPADGSCLTLTLLAQIKHNLHDVIPTCFYQLSIVVMSLYHLSFFVYMVTTATTVAGVCTCKLSVHIEEKTTPT